MVTKKKGVKNTSLPILAGVLSGTALAWGMAEFLVTARFIQSFDLFLSAHADALLDILAGLAMAALVAGLLAASRVLLLAGLVLCVAAMDLGWFAFLRAAFLAVAGDAPSLTGIPGLLRTGAALLLALALSWAVAAAGRLLQERRSAARRAALGSLVFYALFALAGLVYEITLALFRLEGGALAVYLLRLFLAAAGIGMLGVWLLLRKQL